MPRNDIQAHKYFECKTDPKRNGVIFPGMLKWEKTWSQTRKDRAGSIRRTDEQVGEEILLHGRVAGDADHERGEELAYKCTNFLNRSMLSLEPPRCQLQTHRSRLYQNEI